MSEKDKWDKFDIIFKAIVLGVIPIVIAFGADNIAQSLKRGELVRSLISDLTQPDAKRDVALIALDAAIPPQQKCSMFGIGACQNDPDQDQVVNIAITLIKNSIDDASKKGQSPSELEVAKRVIYTRASEAYYSGKFDKIYHATASGGQSDAISNVQVTPPSAAEKESKAKISQTIAAIQPSTTANRNEQLAGVRLVFIQYKSDRKLTEKLQKSLQTMGVSAPGFQQVSGITQNDIRYANAEDRSIAENLQAYLKTQDIEIEKLIDLSKANYSVPSGQIEIWLKD